MQLERFSSSDGSRRKCKAPSPPAERAQKKQHRGWGREIFDCFQCVVQRVGRPGQLPYEKIAVTILLVEVSEDEEHQQGYDTRSQHQACHCCSSSTLPLTIEILARMQLCGTDNPVTPAKSKRQVSSGRFRPWARRFHKYCLIRCESAMSVVCSQESYLSNPLVIHRTFP